MRPSLFALSPIVLAATFLSLGCTHYEYDIVSPPDLRQHIGSKQNTAITIGPIEYRMISYEDHLVVEVYNRAPDNLQFLGDQSTIVAMWRCMSLASRIGNGTAKPTRG